MRPSRLSPRSPFRPPIQFGEFPLLQSPREFPLSSSLLRVLFLTDSPELFFTPRLFPTTGSKPTLVPRRQFRAPSARASLPSPCLSTLCSPPNHPFPCNKYLSSPKLAYIFFLAAFKILSLRWLFPFFSRSHLSMFFFFLLTPFVPAPVTTPHPIFYALLFVRDFCPVCCSFARFLSFYSAFRIPLTQF